MEPIVVKTVSGFQAVGAQTKQVRRGCWDEGFFLAGDGETQQPASSRLNNDCHAKFGDSNLTVFAV